MKQAEAILYAKGQSNGNPGVGRQTFFKAVFLAAAALGLLTLCLSCAHLSAKPVLVVFETELGNITVAVDVAHAPITGKNVRGMGSRTWKGMAALKRSTSWVSTRLMDIPHKHESPLVSSGLLGLVALKTECGPN